MVARAWTAGLAGARLRPGWSRRARRYRRPADGPARNPQRRLRLRAVPARSGRSSAGRTGRPRCARRDADRCGQIAVLPAPGADARRPHPGRLAAGLAHAGPGRRAGAVAPGRVEIVNAQRGGAANAAALERALGGEFASSTSPRSGSPPRASPTPWPGPGSGSSWSTRRTASRSGDTTSARTTSPWPTPPAGSAPGRRSRSPRPPLRGSLTTSPGGSPCGIRSG